ncbi:MAG: recombinase family protein [Chloroflexota bacterium]|nr:recombinase family protein [Chloroflexota bacterium]
MNCLLYARVSTDKQAQKELSIPAQIAAMKEYVKRNGWHVIGHFIDEGESAKTADRPELKRLIQHCKDEKNVNVVLVHKIDRLAKNLIDYATIKAILKQKGIKLVSVSEPFDDNPIGHLLENIIASISEWYSANLGEEIKKGQSCQTQKGRMATQTTSWI